MPQPKMKYIIPSFILGVTVIVFYGYGYLQNTPQSFASDQVATTQIDREIAPKETIEPKIELKEEVIEKKIFGYSEKGRVIDGYEIGKGENCIVLFAGMHGVERGAVDLLNIFSKEIVANPALVNLNNKLILIPLVNPDGYHERDDKLNINGVNINRNFETTDWFQIGLREETYAGPQPFSENESRVLKRVIEDCQARMIIAYHSQGELVSPEEEPQSEALARWYSDKTGYEYFDEWHFAGTATRWFEETVGGAAMTVELTNHSESDWQINREALFELVSGELLF